MIKMNDELKELIASMPLLDGEEITEETLKELSDNKGDED